MAKTPNSDVSIRGLRMEVSLHSVGVLCTLIRKCTLQSKDTSSAEDALLVALEDHFADPAFTEAV